jgi:hypothetical protein
MKTQHTPGPRKIHDLNTSTPHVGTISNAKAIFGRTLAIIDNYKTNATPIAAAPELLEALEYINKQIDKVFGYDLPEDIDGLMRGISDAVDEAITKVKGE